jgi:hypothetical protein
MRHVCHESISRKTRGKFTANIASNLAMENSPAKKQNKKDLKYYLKNKK